MTEYTPASIPLPLGIMLTNDYSHSSLEETKKIKDIPYHEALGPLM